ncbi:MAG: cytochrome c biogenesis protein CcsA [Acidobacteriota bacterium]|nr:MAG: cytochrome c biogenesis protein CcsA [Acidobacteriota bacterium]
MRTSRVVVRAIIPTALAVLTLSAVPSGHLFAEDSWELSVGRSFAQQVDLDSIRVVAVQDGGRVKTFDSLARERLKYVWGARMLRETDPVLLYLDMMLIPQHYAGRPVIEIHKPAVRHKIVQMIRSETAAAERHGVITEPELDRIAETGRVSLMFLDHPVVQAVLQQLERDLMGVGKEIDKLSGARTLADSRTLRAMLTAVAPPGGSELDPWLPIDRVASGGMPKDQVHAGLRAEASGVPGIDSALARTIAGAWDQLEQAWRFQDAPAANAALSQLAESLPLVEPALYPSSSRLGWEHWYYSRNKLTRTWILYFLAVPFLLMAVVYGFRWARITGLSLFVIAAALHTLAIGLRWYLAGRIPNANMFEAITASAWLGVVVALVMEIVLRRWPVKNLPALAASLTAMIALMVHNFFPIRLSSDITTVAPLLDRTVWLYIHTNMIIASYALIFCAAITAGFYLIVWAAHSLVASPKLATIWTGGGAEALAGGGAASIILGRGLEPGEARNSGLARTLDGATMIFLELAFVTLWAGTILGAVWADVSWGRPWGWDPKEVFALNTWLVFLVLLHVRLKVKEKGFWTAVLAVVGCLVMLFNWIAVNFVIVGLHSYA